MPAFAEPSETAICNLALAGAGSSALITALDENSQAARLCRLRYAFARDAVLRAHDWNFAAKRASLAANANPPAFEFACAYEAPPDCLLVRSVEGEDNCPWSVEGRTILSDQSAPLRVKYTARIGDPAAFDALYADALAARLAADLALPLSESPSRASSLWQVYQQKLAEAQTRDANEGFAKRNPRSDWLDARFEPGFVI